MKLLNLLILASLLYYISTEEACQSRQFLAEYDKTCQPCNQNCFACDNAITCLTCLDGYELSADSLCIAAGNATEPGEPEYPWLEEFKQKFSNLSMDMSVNELVKKFPFLEKIQEYINDNLDLEQNWTESSLSQLKERNWSEYGEHALQDALGFDREWNLSSLNLSEIQEKISCEYVDKIIEKLNLNEQLNLSEIKEEIEGFNLSDYAKEKIIEHISEKIKEQSETGEIADIKEVVEGALDYNYSDFNFTKFEEAFSSYNFDIKAYLLEHLSKKTNLNTEDLEKLLKYNYQEFNYTQFLGEFNLLPEKQNLTQILTEEFDESTAEAVEQILKTIDEFELTDAMKYLGLSPPSLIDLLKEKYDDETAERIQQIIDDYSSQDEPDFKVSEIVDGLIDKMNLSEILLEKFNASEVEKIEEMIHNISDYNYSEFNYETLISKINFTELHLQSYESLVNLTMDEFIEDIRTKFNISEDSILYDFLLEFEFMADGDLSFEETMALFEQYNVSQYWTEEKVEQLIREYNSTLWQFILDEYDQTKKLTETEFQEYTKNKWHSLIKALIYQKGQLKIEQLGDLSFYQQFTWEDAFQHLAEEYNLDGVNIDEIIEKFNFSDFSNFKNLSIEAIKKELEEKIQQHLDDQFLDFNLTEFLLEKLNVTLDEYKELKTEWDQFNWTAYFESKIENFSYDNFNFSEYFDKGEFGFNKEDFEKLLTNQTWFENFNFEHFYNQSQWADFQDKLKLDINLNEIMEKAWMKNILSSLDLSEENMLLFFQHVQEEINDAIQKILTEIEPEFGNETDPNETDPNETDPNETDPNETDPNETDPNETDPNETDPNETDPNETEPEICNPSEIPDCLACETAGICTVCKNGKPFEEGYELLGVNYQGLCKCQSGMYKTKDDQNSPFCKSLADVDVETTFSNETLEDQSLDELAESSQIAYAMQDDETMTSEKKETIQNSIIDHLNSKLTETAVTAENLDTVIDVVETVEMKSSSKKTQQKVVDTLASVAQQSSFTSDDDFAKIMNLVTEIDTNLTNSDNQKEIENNVLKPLSKNFLKVNKEALSSGDKKSIKLSTGVMEFSKIETEQTFTGAKLQYPPSVLESLKGGASEVMVTVKVIDKNDFKKVGASAELQVNPMSIDNFKMNEDGLADAGYSGDTSFSICFDGLAELSNPVCMYWDGDNNKWSDEGVLLNTDTNCCESKHFSTFGVIKSGEQTIEIDNTNPGEYGEGLSCSSKTSGCLECDAVSGECLICIGYYAPIGDNKVCLCSGENERIVYSAASDEWSCSSDTSSIGALYTAIDLVDCENSITLEQFNKMKELSYLTDTETQLQFLTNKLHSCKDQYTTEDAGQALLIQAEILNGIMKTSSDALLLESVNKAILIAKGILENESTNLNIYKHLMEFFQQATYKFQEAGYAPSEAADIEYQTTIKSALQDNTINCAQKILSKNTPPETSPKNYHFSNTYMRQGQLITSQKLTSLLYFSKFGIQLEKELLTSYSTETHYFIHLVQKYTPYSISLTEQAKSYAQYFRIYDKDFQGIEQNELVHCGDNAAIKFSYAGDSNFIGLQTWKSGELKWSNKILCYNDEEQYQKICFPANYNQQFLFIINEIEYKEPLLFEPAECSIDDISGCSECNSEKECKVCELGAMLIGEYYGRCECPSGYYKDGFTATTCKKDEYVNEEWNDFTKVIGDATLNQEFFDKALLVAKVNKDDAYTVYMNKLAELINGQQTSITDSDMLDQILVIMEIYSAATHKDCEQNYLALFEVFNGYAITRGIEENQYLNLIQIGEKILFKMNDRQYKDSFYKLVFKEIILTYYSPTPRQFSMENGQLEIQNINGPQEVKIGDVTLNVDENLWTKMQMQECDNYQIAAHNMESQNPYDYIQIAQFYSNIVNITFSPLGEGLTQAQCVYWDETKNAWLTDGGRSDNFNNQCEWQHFTTFAIIKSNSASTICNPKCNECSSYDICTSCESTDYLISEMCYSKNELALEMILQPDKIFYIRSFKQKDQCLGVFEINENKYEPALFDCYQASVSYTQILWEVSINSEQQYTFTNIYLKNEEIAEKTLKAGGDDKFTLQKISELNGDMFSLYKNEARLALAEKCFSSDTLTEETFTKECSNNQDLSLWWEFLPKKSTDHSPMPLKITTQDNQDGVVISYDHSGEDDLSEVVFVIAEQYPTTINSLDTLKCSSSNSESLVEFLIRSKDTLVTTNLGKLKECGFHLNQLVDENQYKLNGVFAHVFLDSQQVFYNNVEIMFSSILDISTDVVNEAQITQINIQQYGTTYQFETNFVASVALEDDASQTGTLEVASDFTIKVSLPSTVTSKYAIQVPSTATFKNALETTYTSAISLQSTTATNTYLIDVSLTSNDNGVIPDGQYRLKFQCTLSLAGTRILLTRFLSSKNQAGLIVDKAFSVNRTNVNNTSSTPAVYENTEGLEDNDEAMSMNVGIILLIVLSGLVAVALITAIIYYAWKIQKNKKMREKMESAKNQESQGEIKKESELQLPEIEIQAFQKEENKV